MEQKLNAIQRFKTIKQTLFVATSIIAILSIVSYYYLQNNNKNLQTIKHDNLKNSNKNIVLKNTSSTNQNPKTTLKKITNGNNKNVVVTSDTNKNTTLEILTEENTTNPITKNDVDSSTENTINKKTQMPISSSLSAEFIIYNAHICIGNVVSFEALENSKNTSFLWDFGDGTTSANQKPNHNYKESGIFDVTLKITNKNTNEELVNTKKKAITIYPKPIADFNWIETALNHNNNVLKYPYTKFKVKSNENNTYIWNFSNGKVSKNKNPEILFKSKGEYIVTLFAKNSFGCSNKVLKTINITQSFNLKDYTPTGFRPNSSNPENNTFLPKALLVFNVDFTMTITDKFGNIVYETSDKNAPWNGKLNNSGEYLETGTYFWNITTIDIENVAHQNAGTITLIK